MRVQASMAMALVFLVLVILWIGWSIVTADAVYALVSTVAALLQHCVPFCNEASLLQICEAADILLNSLTDKLILLR